MQILQIKQGSDEWLQARLGKPTASRFGDIITPDKGDKSKTYMTYMYELLGELLAGDRDEVYRSQWMDRGNELELQAREKYEFLKDITIKTVGIVFNDDLTIGASPDGLIADNAGIEIKCPKSSTIVKYMLDDRLPLIYKPQVQGNLWICEREYWDFIAYHPNTNMFINRVYRDEEYIKKMAIYLNEFVDELKTKHDKLKDKVWL